MLGFGFDRRLRKIRKNWCKLRLKILKFGDSKKTGLLDKLDNVEQDLRTLEEQELRRMDRNRIADSVENELREIGNSLKIKEPKEEQTIEEIESRLRQYK